MVSCATATNFTSSIDPLPRRLNPKMDLDLSGNILTERDLNIALRTVDIPKQGKKTQDDLSEDTRMNLSEESAAATSPTMVSTRYVVRLHMDPGSQQLRNTG